MSDASAVQFRRFDRAGAREQRDIVALIHREAYAADNASKDAFASERAFMQRFDAYTSRSEFDLVIAYHGSEPIGQTWGWLLPPDTAWWDNLISEPGLMWRPGTGRSQLAPVVSTIAFPSSAFDTPARYAQIQRELRCRNRRTRRRFRTALRSSRSHAGQ